MTHITIVLMTFPTDVVFFDALDSIVLFSMS